jgi:hypothetical protein
MISYKKYSRRLFFKMGILGTAGIGLMGMANSNENTYGILQADGTARRLPYKIGIRQALLRNPLDPKKDMVANFDTFKFARDISGIKILGKDRIAAVHVKNHGRLISDNWRVDWVDAFSELTGIQYEGWLTFETDHESHKTCIRETEENIAFIRQHFQPPMA